LIKENCLKKTLELTKKQKNHCYIYLVTALVPSDTACLAS